MPLNMIHKYQLIIIVFSISFFVLFNQSYADENEKTEYRLNTGYYFNSINQVASRSDIEISLSYWGKELFDIEAKKHNFRISAFHAYLYDRMEDMRKAFDDGDLDMIVAPPLLISKYFKREELADGFIGVLEGGKQESMILIVRIDKNINSINDLQDKRLEMIETDDLADVLLDTLTLKNLHKSYKNIGLSIQYPKKVNMIILDVFFDKADAGLVYANSLDVMSDLNPAIKDKIKILSSYPIKAKNFSYFRRGYPLVDQFSNFMQDFPNSPKGKQILEIYKTPNLDHCRLEDLDSFDTLYKEYLQLKKNTKK